jgi:hypothetical protein
MADMAKQRLDEHSRLVAGFRPALQFHLFHDLGNCYFMVSELSILTLTIMDYIRGSSVVGCCNQYLWVWPHTEVQSDDLYVLFSKLLTSH